MKVNKPWLLSAILASSVAAAAFFVSGIDRILAQSAYCTGLCSPAYLWDSTTNDCGNATPVPGQPDTYTCYNNLGPGNCSRTQRWIDGYCATNEEPTGMNCFTGQVYKTVTVFFSSCDLPNPPEGACTCKTMQNGEQQQSCQNFVTNTDGC